MKIYVASAGIERQRARDVMRAIEWLGYENALDWTRMLDEYPNDDAPPDVSKKIAEGELEAVRHADVLVLLTPERRDVGLGCYIETGIALAMGKRVIVVGVQRDRSIFYDLCEKFPTEIGLIMQLAAEAE